MRTRMITPVLLVALVALGAGCSQDPMGGADDPNNPYLRTKNGTETLGPPSITIAAGSGFAEGGVGMVGVSTGVLSVDVPADAQIQQVLLYWAGASTDGTGDDSITLDGIPVQGELIGGPTLFFSEYEFSAYRADITDLELVAPGSNSVEVAGFDFAISPIDENNGASILVIHDGGPATALELRDGLDMAFFGFQPTLDATVPQVFDIAPSNAARTAELVLVVASVGENRPNRIKVTTAGGDQFFDDVLGSNDGLAWDSIVLEVDVPAGADEVSVQLISTESQEPLGASLGWVAAGLTVENETFDVSGTVFVDADEDQTQGIYELGIANVTVLLLDGALQIVDTYVTGEDGAFVFAAAGGDYTVQIPLGTEPDQFNYDIAQSFAPTGALTLPVTAGTGSTSLEFGLIPRPGDILNDLATGVLITNGESLDYWQKVLRRTIIEEGSGRKANGHGGEDDGTHDGPEGWGHPGWYPTPEEMAAVLLQIEELYLPYPYQFTDGEEVEEAYQILRTKAKTDEEKLFQELLVSELNFVAGLGLIGEADRLGVLISWGETLINIDPNAAAKSGEKDYKSDVRNAFEIFKAINTGGGGGVDE